MTHICYNHQVYKTMYNSVIIFAILLTNIVSLSFCFLKFPQPIFHLPIPNAACNNCGNSYERTIYRNYLLGLRKTRKLLTHNTLNSNNTVNAVNAVNAANNIDTLASIIDFTSEFVSNYTSSTNQTVAKHIIMGNIVLDVSNIKEIHIKTEKDVLVIELDKKKPDIQSVITNMNNADAIISSLSLVAKILNIT